MIKSGRYSGLKGPIFLTVAAVCYSVMAIGVRIAGAHGIPAGEALVVRFVFGAAAVGVIHWSGVSRVRFAAPWLLVMRGITGGAAISLYFASLAAAGAAGTTLTNSALLGNSSFIYAPVFGALLIKERLRLRTAAAVVAALVGLYLVVSPDFSQLRLGDLYGFGAGISAGFTIIVVRELRKYDTSAITVFLALAIAGIIIGSVMMLFQRPVPIDRRALMALAAVGLAGTAGQIVMTYAFRFVRAGEGSVIIMTTVIYSAVAGVLWFGDPLNAGIVAGMALVIASAFVVSMAEAKTATAESAGL